MNYNDILTLSKRLNINSLPEIISKINFVFKIQNKKRHNFFLNFEKVIKVDIIGMLVLYKFIEYAVEKKCFINPKTNFNDPSLKIVSFAEKFGFDNYINAYIKNQSLDRALNKLKVSQKSNFLIAPQVLIRGNLDSKKKFDVSFKENLDSFYGSTNQDFIEAIFQCAIEISSNFYNHAVKDTKSIILAHGSNHNVEIACADTADGLLNTLRENSCFEKDDDEILIEKAFRKNITSKPNSNHMGYGLWFIKEIIKRYDGHLELYTSNLNFTSKFGSNKVKESPNWDGTIIYLKLPVKNGIEIADILKKDRKENSFKPKINFIN